LAVFFAAIMIQATLVAQTGPIEVKVSNPCPQGDPSSSPEWVVRGDPVDYGSEPWQNILPDLVVPVDQPSVQDAVNVACSGDVVMVLAGTYAESVTIGTPIYLIGASIDQENYTHGLNISTTDFPLIISTFGPSISITADNVTVDSFRIEGGGVELNSAKGALLTSNVIAPWSGAAIRLSGAEESRVVSNDILGGQYGIRLDAQSKDNEIGPDNLISYSDVGIWVGDYATENEVYQNDVTDGSVGLYVESSPGNRMHHNKLRSLDYCVQYRESDFGFISRNIMEGEGFGLVVTDSGSLRIQSNDIATEDDAMLLQDVGKTGISGNSLRSSDGMGINILPSTSLKISLEDNVLLGDTTGLRAKNVVDLLVERNSFGGGQIGLEVLGESPIIKENQFSAQTGPSLRVSVTDGATIAGNVFDRGNGWALDLSSSSNADISDNEVTGSAYGFLLQDVNSAIVQGNTIRDTDLAMRLINTPGTFVTENTFDLNTMAVDLQTNGAKIYHNWFLNNLNQVSQGTPGFQNDWHDGNGHGNYWLDYKGEDLNYDAVGDTLLPHQLVDYYPLTKRSFHAYLTFLAIIEEIRTLLDDPYLHHGIRNSLLVKVDHIQRNIIRKEKPEAARGSLTAFENEINAQLDKKIPPGMADELRQRALDARVAINETDSDSDGLGLIYEEASDLSYANPDTDNDFVSDTCELRNGLNPRDGSDWRDDPDNDMLNNYMECLFGTNPRRKDTDGDTFKGNFNDGAELSYWEGRGIIDAGLLWRIWLHLVDPFDEGALTVAEQVQIIRVSQYLNTGDEDADGYVGGWEANAPGFDPLNRCNGIMCISPNVDPEEDGIINMREYATWRAGFDTDPAVQDVIVEVDWVQGFDPRDDFRTFLGNDPDDAPNWVAGGNTIPDNLEAGVFAYKKEGMNLVLFYDDELPSWVDGADDRMSKSEANFVYDVYFDALDDDSVHAGISRYGVLVDEINIAGCGCSGIASRIRTDFFLVAFGTLTTDRRRSSTFIHELGHALGLRHGGNHDTNFKPNYNSVMNYRFQFPGVDGSDPPDYDCNDPVDDLVDYSHGLNPPLDEGPYVGLLSPELNARCSGAARPDGWLGEAGFGTHIMFCWGFGWFCGGDTNLYDFDDWGYIQSTLTARMRHRDF
jgi:parallel beta-helix repeat protein